MIQKLYSNRLCFRMNRYYINRYTSNHIKNNDDIIRKHYPIAIIGGGPVGLLLSLLLSQYNVKHYLLEKRYSCMYVCLSYMR
jgi:ribulose 1,5-bisphosphate synthetase/thiazole synthase